ncbi:hypothetical protein [Azotobacter beijerinckii]|uniref:Uncharacterized protein n=1 Tax=Azotobacter beijerinckii TaxID=170623 RepID=A0A1I1B7U1_9GAMM|nr:hypothetical protein [Azotobacter beijerinckii]SFB46455.1 hypothetical protein SAMN04244571_03009 [Azotobacter beijerinckii]
MDGRFGRALGRLHGVSAARLSDSTGSYAYGPDVTVTGIDLMVDRNLQREGPDGMFISGVIGISWPAAQLATADRGGIFTIGSEHFTVEALIANDGHYITAACMRKS